MIPVELLELGKTLALPSGVAVLLATAAQRLPDRARVTLAALGAALAYGAADWWIAGTPGFPPRDVTHWVPWLMVGGLLASWFGQDRKPLSLAVWILLAAALTGLLFRPLIRNDAWGRTATVLWFMGTGGVLAAVWAPFRSGVGRPAWLLFQLCLVAVAASACAFLGYSQKHAQLTGALAAVAFAGLAPWIGPSARRAMATGTSIGLAGLLVLIQHYGSQKVSMGQRTTVVLLLCASWATAIFSAREDAGRGRRKWFVAAGAVLAVVAVGMALWIRLTAPEDPYGY